MGGPTKRRNKAADDGSAAGGAAGEGGDLDVKDSGGGAGKTGGGNDRRSPRGGSRLLAEGTKRRAVAVLLAVLLGWAIWPKDGSAPFRPSLEQFFNGQEGSNGTFSHSETQLKLMLEDMGVSLDGFLDYVPALGNLIDRDRGVTGDDVSDDVADAVNKEPREAKHPVVIIPGITNTPLEIFKAQKCAKTWLRRLLWGSVATSARLFTSNSTCYMEHLSLDEETGLDPEGIAVRAVKDLSSIETVFGLDMWKMMVDNLVRIGYDNNNMYGMPYDWRLSAHQLQARDGYFSRLRLLLEYLVSFHGEKVVLMTHSYGGNVAYQFLAWVEREVGEGWVETHVAVLANIGVPFLGVAKAIPALLSGETKDTVGLGGLGVRMGDIIMPRKQRLRVIRSFGCIINMLPKGGNGVWGTLGQTEDGDALDYGLGSHHNGSCADSPGAFLTINRNGTTEEMDIEAASRLLLETVPEPVRQRIRDHGALYAGIKEFMGKSEKHDDALTTPLPNAPSMRILCLYGVDVPTERRYYYRENDPSLAQETGTVMTLDTNVETDNGCTQKGVNHCNGDATVPLVSLGALCRKWSQGVSRLNPGGSKVTTVEYPHQTSTTMRFDLRGGPTASDHLDIMGNAQMLRHLVEAASGHVDDIEENIVSKIDAITASLVLPGWQSNPEDITVVEGAGKNEEVSLDPKMKNDEL